MTAWDFAKLPVNHIMVFYAENPVRRIQIVDRSFDASDESILPVFADVLTHPPIQRLPFMVRSRYAMLRVYIL